MKSKTEWIASKTANIKPHLYSDVFAKNEVDIHIKDLIEWLAMEGSVSYADEAIERGAVGGILNILREGQLLELMDAWDDIYFEGAPQ